MKVLLLIFVFASVSIAQSVKCDLVNAPAIRGISLGMTREELLLAIPPLKSSLDEKEDSFLFTTQLLSTMPLFENIERLSISFDKTHTKVDSLWLWYVKVPFDNAEAFAANVSKNLQLPLGAWRYSHNGAFMQCSTFFAMLGRDNLWLFAPPPNDPNKPPPPTPKPFTP